MTKYKFLDNVNFPSDIKNLKSSELITLSKELREELIEAVSFTGGHLGAGLGVVELTVALHYVFDTPNDKIVWDVGHQSYPHKILTGRKNRIKTLRQGNGLSGFTKRSESEYDPFGAAHSSTSISAALGIATANKLSKKSENVVAVIGDGAISAGMAYEAMNNAGISKTKMIVILNDNDMSIAEPVGAMRSYLAKLLTGKIYFSLRETFKIRHFKPELKNEDVIDNTKFNVIKKSRKKSKGIDEKIEYLNKECQKTGLQEVMTTTNMYTVVQTVPAAPAEFDDVPDVDPVNGITSDNWTQPLGNDDNGNPASEPPTTFPRIWDNPGYSDPTDGLLNKNDLTGNGTALPIYKTDDLTWQDPSEIPAGAVGGMQIEVGGMDPGIVGGYLDSNGWNTTTGTHVRLGAPNFKTHPHLFKPVKYWQPFSIYHPYIDSYWPGGDKTPKYGGIVKGSLDGPKYALFTAYMYVGGGRNTYQTSPNTHSYPIVLKTDDLGDPLFLPIDIGRFGLSPQGFYWLKDRATDLAKKYKSEDDMWDAMADFLDTYSDPAEDPFSRKGTGMDDRWIGPPVDKA